MYDVVGEAHAPLRFHVLAPRITEVSQVQPAEVLGVSLFAIGRADPDGRTTYHADLVARQPFRDLRCRHELADGQVRHMRVSGTAVFDTVTGAFQGYRGTGTDITAEIEAEERRVVLEAQLQQIGRAHV